MGVSLRVDFSVGEMPRIDSKARAGSLHLYSDKHLVVSYTTAPAGISFAGEIDVSNSQSVGRSIAGAVSPGGDLHIDVTHLLFCDVSGIRAFVSAAEAMPQGRRMLLHGMPPQLETVMRVVGWNQLPGLVVCECGSD
jgi:anti-anti-sigma factor